MSQKSGPKSPRQKASNVTTKTPDSELIQSNLAAIKRSRDAAEDSLKTRREDFTNSDHGAELVASAALEQRSDSGLVTRPTAVVNKYLELRAKKDSENKRDSDNQQIQPVVQDFPASLNDQRAHSLNDQQAQSLPSEVSRHSELEKSTRDASPTDSTSLQGINQKKYEDSHDNPKSVVKSKVDPSISLQSNSKGEIPDTAVQAQTEREVSKDHKPAASQTMESKSESEKPKEEIAHDTVSDTKKAKQAEEFEDNEIPQPSEKPMVMYEDDHEEAATQIQTLLKPEVWYEEDDYPSVEPEKLAKDSDPTHSQENIQSREAGQNTSARSQNEASDTQTDENVQKSTSHHPKQSAAKALLSIATGTETNKLSSPSEDISPTSGNNQREYFGSQSPRYSRDASSSDKVFNQNLTMSPSRDSLKARKSSELQDYMSAFQNDYGVNHPISPRTPQTKLGTLSLSTETPEAEQGSKERLFSRDSEVAMPLTFRELPDHDIAELYQNQLQNRQAYDRQTPPELRVLHQEKELSDILTAPEEESDNNNHVFKSSKRPESRNLEAQNSEAQKSLRVNVAQKRERSSPLKRRNSFGQPPLHPKSQFDEDEVSNSQSDAKRRASGQFRGFDISSHKHASPITSPRATGDSPSRTSGFEFFNDPSDLETRTDLSLALSNQDDETTQDYSENEHHQRLLNSLDSDSTRTATSESEISLAENLNDNHSSTTGPSQAEMESPETKEKLEEADIIPLPDRSHSHKSGPTAEQAALGRAGNKSL